MYTRSTPALKVTYRRYTVGRYLRVYGEDTGTNVIRGRRTVKREGTSTQGRHRGAITCAACVKYFPLSLFDFFFPSRQSLFHFFFAVSPVIHCKYSRSQRLVYIIAN